VRRTIVAWRRPKRRFAPFEGCGRDLDLFDQLPTELFLYELKWPSISLKRARFTKSDSRYDFRIVRIRDDKPPSEIDTLDRVKEIYAQMLGREAYSSEFPP